MYSHKAYYYTISVSVICYSSCLFSFNENRNCWLFFGKFYFIDFIFNFRLWKWYCRSVVIYNMKRARPWMLANLKIICQFHAHPVHQKVWRYIGPRYIGDDFFLGPNLVSFNRTVVPYVYTKSQKLTSAYKQIFLSVCQKRFNKLKNINISKTS